MQNILSMSDIEIADQLYQEGYYLDAAKTYRKYINSQNQEDNPTLSQAYLKLGETLLKCLETKEALTVLFKALELKKKLEQTDFRGVVEILLKIGKAYILDEEYAEPEKHLNKAKQILMEKYGEDDPDMAVYYNLLGAVNTGQGDHLISLANFQKSIKVAASSNPQNSAEIARAYLLMSGSYSWLRDYTEGLNYALKGLKVRTELYGEDHPEIASCYDTIGWFNHRQAKYEEALQNYYKALRIRKEFLGEYHQSNVGSYNSIGMIQEILGDYSNALESYQKCLEIYVASGEENHPGGAAVHQNIGNLYRKRDWLDHALRHYNKAIEINVHVSGEGNPKLCSLYTTIANIHQIRNEFNESEENLLKAWNIRLKFPSNNKGVAVSYQNFGKLYSVQKEYSRGVQNYLKALQISSSLLRDEDLVADCFRNLYIVMFQKVKDASLGQSCGAKAHQVYRKILGKNHKKSRRSNRELKEADEARSLLNINDELRF